MASALYENIENWRPERQSGDFGDHYSGISDEIDPKEPSFEVTNEEGKDAGNGNHCNSSNGIHEESNDIRVNEEDDESNDEPEENEEGNASVPYYGKTLVAPEYMSFQTQGRAASQKEDNGVEDIGGNDCAVTGGSGDFGKDNTEGEETSHYTDQFGLGDGKGDSYEDRGGESETSVEVKLRNEDHVEGSPHSAQLEDEDEKENEDDFKDNADLHEQNEREGDGNEAYKEGPPSKDDEVERFHEDEGEDGEQERDETENEDNDEDNKGSTDVAGEKEQKRDEDDVFREERPSKDGLEEELCEDDGEDSEKERDDAKVEETVEREEQSEDDKITGNIEDNKVDEYIEEKHDTEDKKGYRGKETINEDVESSQEDDEIDDDSGDDQLHHEYTITQDKDAVEESEDKSVSAKDMPADRLTRLEHCDSLRVNVASPTRDISNVSSTESLNETDAGHVEGDDADKGTVTEKLTDERDEEPEATISESVEVNDDQQNEDGGEEVIREDESSSSDEDANEFYQDETKENDDRDDDEEDLEPDLEEEDAKSEEKAEDEDVFPVRRNPQGHGDEADLTGKVKELGRIFEGGGPVFPKGVKKGLDAADGLPVSVRKFKAIFETHQYSAERTHEPERREESSSPPSGIVKNLRGLFENPQGFETRNG